MTRSSPTYNDMIYADTPEEVQKRRKAFLRKWRLRLTNSLEEAGDRLFTFTTLPPSQWKSARTTNAIERLHEEIKRRIKTQTVLPSAETAAMLFGVLPASGQISMRKVMAGRRSQKNHLHRPLSSLTSPLDQRTSSQPETAPEISTTFAKHPLGIIRSAGKRTSFDFIEGSERPLSGAPRPPDASTSSN